jgi:hypothetical protein
MILAAGIELAKNKSACRVWCMRINTLYEWPSVVGREGWKFASPRTGADYFLVALQ